MEGTVHAHNTSSNTFHLAISMAGAISAGAYTAGVIDYLTETLERWQVAKKNIAAAVPQHNIVIDILSGASAGGMTAAITTAAIHSEFNHINGSNPQGEKYNILYDCWVNFTSDLALKDLLAVDDIDENAVISLLNSKTIDKIGEKVSGNTGLFQKPIPDYFSKELEIILTLSNLTGIPFYVKYEGDLTEAQQFLDRRDFAHFKLGLAKIGRIPLKMNKTDIFFLVEAAKATGAFPVGLSSRILVRKKQYIEQNEFINPLIRDNIRHGNNTSIEIPDEYRSLNIDGGVFNNEPMEVTRQLLMSLVKGINLTELLQKGKTDITPQNDTNANFAVIMVDPFPAVDAAPEKTKVTEAAGYKGQLLSNIIPRIVTSMRSQLLFDAKNLQQALDSKNFNAFLIAPKIDTTENSNAIACGSLGGFGGFLKKDFRIHDFFLGRRNCQRFLQEHLLFPIETENEIIKYGYNTPELKTKFKITSKGVEYLPLIPDVLENGELNTTEELLVPKPQLTESELELYRPFIIKRYRKIMANTGLKGFSRFIAITAAFLTSGKVADAVTDYIKKDLTERGLYKEN
ncbi:MAG TPA: patatin-like phospholipase family protein [Bacteroidia bacterium]|jgi:predicted acylesterase/phospholipase RssA|nr:patatin-like phospholipase family protein [Bacteroidia bacterium]